MKIEIYDSDGEIVDKLFRASGAKVLIDGVRVDHLAIPLQSAPPLSETIAVGDVYNPGLGANDETVLAIDGDYLVCSFYNSNKKLRSIYRELNELNGTTFTLVRRSADRTLTEILGPRKLIQSTNTIEALIYDPADFVIVDA